MAAQHFIKNNKFKRLKICVLSFIIVRRTKVTSGTIHHYKHPSELSGFQTRYPDVWKQSVCHGQSLGSNAQVSIEMAG